MGLDCVMERESSSESPLSPSLYSENDDGAAERVPLGSCFWGKILPSFDSTGGIARSEVRLAVSAPTPSEVA